MLKKTLFIYFSVLIFGFSTLSAQTHISFGGQMGLPTGNFKENTTAMGGGFYVNAYFPFAPKVPIFFGLNFDYMVYGSNRQQINQNLNVTGTVNGQTVVLSSIPVNLGVNTNNNLINALAAIRFKAPLATVQPYVEGVVGFNYFYTRTKIIDNTPNRIFTSNNNGTNNNNVINARTQINSTVLAYGGGGGVMIKLGQSAAIDLRVLYLLGGEAQYYDRSQTQSWTLQFGGSGTFNPSNPTDVTAQGDGVPKKSTTDMFMVNAGLAFQF